MKVAFVSQPYDAILPPRQNSIGLITYNTAIEMGRNAEVTIFGRRRTGVTSPTELPFRVSFVSSLSDNVLQHVATHYPRWVARLGVQAIADTYSGYARAVSSALDSYGPDVVHVMNYWPWCRRLRGKADKRCVVLEMHAEWLSQMDPVEVGSALEATDAVTAVSDHIARQIRASFPTYRGDVVTTYNGVNIGQFHPRPDRDPASDDAIRILFVGRVSPEKGVHTLIEAMPQVVSRIKGVRLDIVGGRSTLRGDFLVDISSDPLVRSLKRFYDGSMGSEYQTYLDGLVARLGVSQNVRFLGHVPHEELPDRYRMAALVVNPSLSESFGVSIVEGMASGVPVVGTRIGGMLDTVVDGETGLLVEPERPDLLADAVVSLLGDPIRAKQMGIDGRARAVECFSWRARSDRLLSTYRKILNECRM